MLQNVPCATSRREISHYVLLYDWPGHIRDQINRTFQFSNFHGKFFCSFDVSMKITLVQFRSRESGYTQKRPCPWANAIYPWVKGQV